MSFTMTRSATDSWTLTNAKYLASKVTSDMLRCRQNYGSPSFEEINDYGTELALLMRDGFVARYEFGFQRNNQRIISWQYVLNSTNGTDDRPGRILSGISLEGASSFNFLNYSEKWFRLSESERAQIRAELPISRTPGRGPTDGAGSWQSDLTYSSSGVSLGRMTFRPHTV